jgi:hypothetical protein
MKTLPQRGVLGDSDEVVEVERRPALDQLAGEVVGLRRLAVVVGVHPLERRDPGAVRWVEVLAESFGHQAAPR